MFRATSFLAITSLLIGVHSIEGSVFPIHDNTIFWSGYGNGTADDTTDSIGIPDFFLNAGKVVIEPVAPDNRLLRSVEFTYGGPENSPWDLLKYGDLFLDVGANQTWDYVVRTHAYGPGDFSDSGGDDMSDVRKLKIYKPTGLPIALGADSAYQMSNDASVRDGSVTFGDDRKSWDYRQDHPWALDAGYLLGNMTLVSDQVGFSGWQDSDDWDSGLGHGVSTFDFAGLDLDVGERLAIGFTVNCSNDVVYETVGAPEPSTLVIWSLLGICGIAGVRRRQRRAK